MNSTTCSLTPASSSGRFDAGEKRALFITYSFPPYAESQTIRNVYLVRGLVEAGWNVHVVAPDCTVGDGSLANVLPTGVTVSRVSRSPFDLTLARCEQLPQFLGRQVRRLLAVGGGRLLVPDVHMGWNVLIAEQVRRVARAFNPALVVSASGTTTAHLAASSVVKELRVPWIADFGDPWSLNPLFPASTRFVRTVNALLEHRCLKRMSAMVVTTSETRRAYMERFGSLLPTCYVVPCGFDELAMTLADAPSSNAAGANTLSYVGTANNGSRNLGPLIEALRDNADLSWKLKIVGSCGTRLRRKLSRPPAIHAEVTGWVPYQKSLDEIVSSSLLVLYGNDGTLQVPAKVWPYLRSGVPLLYVGRAGVTDPTWNAISAFAGAYHTHNTREELRAAIRYLTANLAHFKAAALARRADPRLAEYEWRHLGRTFARVADSACDSVRTGGC